jgi:hypothetical protein
LQDEGDGGKTYGCKEEEENWGKIGITGGRRSWWEEETIAGRDRVGRKEEVVGMREVFLWGKGGTEGRDNEGMNEETEGKWCV